MDFHCVYHGPVRNNSAPDPASSEGKNTSHLEARLEAMERRLQAMMEAQSPAQSAARRSSSWSENSANGTASSPCPLDSLHNAAQNATEGTVDGMGVITFADESEAGFPGPSWLSSSTSSWWDSLTQTFPGPTSNSAFFGDISSGAAQIETTLGPGDVQASEPSTGVALDYISRPPSPPMSTLDQQQRFQPSLDTQTAHLSELPPRETMLKLINIFFAETGMLFPYIYKKAIFDGLAEIQSPPCQGGLRPSLSALLNTMMAFAVSLAQGSDDANLDNDATAEVFLRRALKLIPNFIVKQANLEILQTLLLLTQYLQSTQRLTLTWRLHRLAVRVAFQIGVHSLARSGKCNILEQEIRKRAWFMCFILDKTFSMTFGRPPAIPNSYLPLEMPLNVELEVLDRPNNQTPLALSPSQSYSTVVLYTQSINLYKLIGETIEHVYENNIEHNTSLPTSELFGRILVIERKLTTWKSQLPLNLQVRSRDAILRDTEQTSLSSKLSSVITLRYLNARMLLHRRLVSRFLLYQDGTKSFDIDDSRFLDTFCRGSLEAALSAAVDTIDLVFALSEGQHKMLTTWWFTIYYTFSSALVIFGVMIIGHTHGWRSSITSDLGDSLRKALNTLETTGKGRLMALRSQKYLTKLVQIADVLGYSNAPAFPSNTDNQGMLGTRIPNTDLSNLSPLNMNYDWNGAFPVSFPHSMHDYLETESYGPTIADGI